MDPGLGSNYNLTSTQERAFRAATGLTSEVRKALKLSAKSMTNENNMTSSTSGLLPRPASIAGTYYITSLRKWPIHVVF